MHALGDRRRDGHSRRQRDPARRQRRSRVPGCRADRHHGRRREHPHAYDEIVYGQGAIRCHPFVQREIEAVAHDNLDAFDRAIFGTRNEFVTRAVHEGRLIGARLAEVPRTPDMRRYYQHLSALRRRSFILSDTGDGSLASLKRRGEARPLADALAYLYPRAACQRYHGFEPEDAQPNYAPARWSVELCLFRIQEVSAARRPHNR